MNKENQTTDLMSTAIGVIASTSKTPFRTAFMLTLGMGMARALLFFLVAGGLIVLYKVL